MVPTPPLPDLLGWVREGERLFGAVLHTLQDYERMRAGREGLEEENRRLREEVEAMREELAWLRAERVDAAETLKTFAEHVTQIATLALQRLGRRGV
jgi:regulator of replication initiation timing